MQVDARNGVGLLDGEVKYLLSSPLTAQLTPTTETSNPIFGKRRLKMWLQVQVTKEGQASFVSGSGTAGKLADFNLIAPKVSPQYVAQFPKINDAVNVNAYFSDKAAMLSFLDVMFTSSEIGEWSQFSPGDLAELSDDLLKISPLLKAAKEFTSPAPKNPREFFQALVRARLDMKKLSPKDLLTLQQIVKKLTGKDFAITPKTLIKWLSGIDTIKSLTELSSDLVVFNIQTKGQGMQVRFIATSLKLNNGS